jgi:hypothetical protein
MPKKPVGAAIPLSTIGSMRSRPFDRVGRYMNEKSENICIELRTRIDDADRRIMDLNANRFGASENAKAIELPLSTLSVRL